MSEHKDLTILLASPFLGLVVVGVIWGFGSLQTFHYFRKYQRDSRTFRTFVAFLWVLDSLQFALIFHAEYFYFVEHYNHPEVLAKPTWSILAHLYLDCLANMLIRGYYGWRLWRFSKNKALCSVLAFLSLSAFVCGFVFASLAFAKYHTYQAFRKLRPFMYIGLSSSAAVDLFIAVAMCLYLYRSRTGFKKTDSILTALIIYSVNSSALTALLTFVCLLTYVVWPDDLTFLGIFFCISKLFFCNLLALLNGRDSLRNRSHLNESSGFTLNGIIANPSNLSENSRPPPGPKDYVSKEDNLLVTEAHDLGTPIGINVTTHITKMQDVGSMMSARR